MCRYTVAVPSTSRNSLWQQRFRRHHAVAFDELAHDGVHRPCTPDASRRPLAQLPPRLPIAHFRLLGPSAAMRAQPSLRYSRGCVRPPCLYSCTGIIRKVLEAASARGAAPRGRAGRGRRLDRERAPRGRRHRGPLPATRARRQRRGSGLAAGSRRRVATGRGGKAAARGEDACRGGGGLSGRCACVPGPRHPRCGRALVRGAPAWDERVFAFITIILIYMTHQTQRRAHPRREDLGWPRECTPPHTDIRGPTTRAAPSLPTAEPPHREAHIGVRSSRRRPR